MSEKIQDIMGTTMEKIKAMATADVIIGDPIVLSESVTAIPVSKASYGFASGGSDFPSKTANTVFGGGGGAGLTVTPVAFLVLQDGKVKIMSLTPESSATEKAIGMVPEFIDLIKDLVSKKDKNKADSEQD